LTGRNVKDSGNRLEVGTEIIVVIILSSGNDDNKSNNLW
jgi:hypothetical protein